MLNIICGRSGSGKTGLIYENIRRDVLNAKRAYLIVPEQQSVISEKQIVSLCGNSCNMHLEVLNFSRLCNRVFREYGGMSQKYIDEGGKALVLAGVLEELAPSLEQYPDCINSEFISRLITQIENIERRTNISAISKVLESENGFDGILSGKLRDISLIYTAYKAKLHENYSDPSDDLERLCETLDEFSFFEDSNVYIDGFFEFCTGEYNVIRRIVSQADNVYISLALGGDAQDESYELCRNSLNTLKELTDKCEVVWLKEDVRTNKNGLKYLKNALFDDFAPKTELCEGVNIFQCRNIYEECILASRIITELVKNKNARWRDISVAVRNPDSYRGIIDLYFEKYSIPFFLSAREDITLKPLLSFVFALLECVSESMRLSSVQRYLKSGLSCLTQDEIFLLENYLITWNINGPKAWEKEWNMNPDGYGAEMTQALKEKLDIINCLRVKVSSPILEMTHAMSRASVKERCEALYNFLSREEILAKLNNKSALLREKGDYSAANEIMTVWNILMNCLDQTVLIMGEKRISARKFNDILKLVCSSYSSSRIPSSLDQVHIGEAGHMRTEDVKYTIILGMCDGEFPKAADGSALLSEKELKALSMSGIDAGESSEFSSYREKLFFSLECHRPSDELYFVWRTNDMAGAELNKSPFVQRVQAVMPSVGEEIFDSRTAVPIAECEAFDYLLANYYNAPEKLSGLYEFFKNRPQYKDKLSYIESALENGGRIPRLSPEFFKGKDMYMSQSSFEKYINCRYSYFINNLLGARAEKRAKIDFSIVGTFIHAVLEKFMKKAGINAKDAGDDEIRQITDEIVQEYISENLPDFDSSTPRFKYLINRISKTALMTVQNLVDELRQSEFEPVMFEAKIGDGAIQPYEITLQDGSKLIFKGIVDRVDTYKSANGEEYVRIVDYKTGKSSAAFKLKDVLNGFKLQMLIYLYSASAGGITCGVKKRSVSPAGILYIPAIRPKIKDEIEVGSGEYNSIIASSFKRSGLLLGDEEIIYAMEKNPGSAYLPVKIKDGKLCAGDSLATMEQFGSLEGYIRRFAADNINCLKKGNIDINPFKLGKNSCEYCDNFPICRYEGNGRKYTTPDDTAQAWAQIQKGEE